MISDTTQFDMQKCKSVLELEIVIPLFWFQDGGGYKRAQVAGAQHATNSRQEDYS